MFTRINHLWHRIKSDTVHPITTLLGQRFVYGAYWSLVGAVVFRISTVIINIVIARHLGKTSFGEFGIIQSTVGVLGIFAGTALGMTGTKYVSELKYVDPAKAGRIIQLLHEVALISSGLMALMCYGASDFLSLQILNAPHLSNLVGQASFLLISSSLASVTQSVLAGLDEFKSIAKINILQAILSLPLTVVLILWTGLSGAVAALTITQSLTLVFSVYALKQAMMKYNLSISHHGVWSEKGILWEFIFPSFLTGVMVQPIFWLTNVFLVNKPSGFDEFAIFSAATQWRMVILFIPMNITSISLNLLSDYYGQRDIRKYKKILRQNLIITAIAAILIALPITIASPWIMSSYGKGFADKWSVLILQVIIGILIACNNVVGLAIMSAGKMWKGFTLNLIWAVILASLAFYLVRWGAIGLSCAILVAYIVHTLIQLGYINSLFQTSTLYQSDQLMS